MSRALQVVLSVFVWWVLVVLPGVLTILGVFGDFEADTDLTGWLFGFWIACFLAQISWLLLVVARAVGQTKDWWLFVACLLPWAVNWAAPYGLAWELVWVAIAGGVAVTMTLLALRSLRLDSEGRPVTATVVKVLRNRMNVVINNIYVRRKVLLAIPGADGTPYRAVLPMLCEIGTSPEPGDKLLLRVDPGNPKHFALDPSYRDQDED